MKKMIGHLIAASVLIIFAACNNAADNKTAGAETKEAATFDLAVAKSAIEAENVKFMDAFKKGDSAAIASMYADDAWMMPPNSEVVKKDGIASLWGQFLHMGLSDFKLITDEVSGNENQLAETGHYELIGADNKPVDKGKYVVVWKPVNGSWKLYRDIWNSSMPAPPSK